MTDRDQVGRPPRQVALSLRLQILFGGAWNTIGWAIVCFGLPFVLVFLPRSEVAVLGVFPDQPAIARGTVRAIETTGMTENDEPIRAIRFGFVVDGVEHKGVSYARGPTVPDGAAVTIEYVPGDPATARVRGMRSRPFGNGAAVVLVFPLLGFALTAYGLRTGRRAVRLLRDGELAQGRLVGKEVTGAKVNDQRVHKLTFVFADVDGSERHAVVRTHRTAALEDSATEALVYDRDHDDAVVLDALPGDPVLDRDGGFVARRPQRALVALILPGLTVLLCWIAPWLFGGGPQ